MLLVASYLGFGTLQFSGSLGVNVSLLGALCPSKSGLMNKQQTYRENISVWFGLVGFSFNASLEPQPRARRRARLAEDAPARHAFWTRRARPNPGTACAA